MGHGRLDRNRIEHLVSGIHAVAAAFFPTNSVTVQLSDQAIYDSTTGSSEADYIIGSNGTVRDQTGAILEAWLSLGASSSYQARATQVSGSTVTGTLGTWLSCSANLQWGVGQARRGWLRAQDVLNTRSLAQARALLAATMVRSTHAVAA